VFQRFFWLLIVDVLILGYVGGAPITPFNIALGQAAAAYYFLHFLVILPLISRFETTLPLPVSISESVFHGEGAEAAPAGQKAQRGGSIATAIAE
jgi:ubiquinol-cytochrome c reductase cytochrome b subunit